MNDLNSNKNIRYDNDDSPKNKIRKNIFVIWLISSIIAIIIFSKYSEYYSIMIFGQLFLGLGLVAIFSRKSEKWLGIPLLLIGTICFVIPYLMINPDSINITISLEEMVLLSLVGGFYMVGLVMVVRAILRTRKSTETYNVSVKAMVIDHDFKRSKSGKLYCPIYKFEFNGKEYQVSNHQYTNIGFKSVGEIVELKINSNNPEQFLDNVITSKVLVVIGIIWVILILQWLLILLIEYGVIKL